MKRVGLVIKPDQKASRKAEELEQRLAESGVAVVRMEYAQPTQMSNPAFAEPAPADLICVFVLGGDGTFLSAARWIGDQELPMIGVKFGDVGFLADTAEDSLLSVAERILNGAFQTERRMRLLARVIRDGEEIDRETVLNDIVINKGALARLAHIDAYVDDHELTSFKSDGLIVATPTGSTAYSLAAGGPIIHPALSAILLTPICPFTLTNRPLIIPDTAEIKLRLAKKSTDIMLTFDGQKGLRIDHRDTIVVTKSPHPIHMITVPNQTYFDVLKTKLRWSGSRI
ncbi:MAG: NAD(+)/NADH kinase [Thermodesulfobacteriota bacterium]